MAGRATITFARMGVRPPVYVVTSLSKPAWETLEMDAEAEQLASENFVFSRHFDTIAKGTYQYKIRIGEGHWVVDESKETGMFLNSRRAAVTESLQLQTSTATATT